MSGWQDQIEVIVAVVLAVVGGAGAVWAKLRTIARDIGSQSEAVEDVREETKPNGGKSLRDAIDRLDRRMERKEQRDVEMEARMGRIESQVGRIHDAIYKMQEGSNGQS